MFLVDTNVVSEMRKTDTGRADAQVVNWATRADPNELFISVVTVLELEVGVLSLDRKDPRQASILRTWLSDYVLTAFKGRILAVDIRVAMRCAKLHVPNRRPDRDAWIAATALAHGLTIVTRNVADFAPTGVAVLNPWDVRS